MSKKQEEAWRSLGMHHNQAKKLAMLNLGPEDFQTKEAQEKSGAAEKVPEALFQKAAEVAGGASQKKAEPEPAPKVEVAEKAPKKESKKAEAPEEKPKGRKKKGEEEEKKVPLTLAEKQKIINTFVKEGLVKRASDPDIEYGHVSWGLTVLDQVTGGGPPKGKFTLISGEPQSGKTATALGMIAKEQKRDPNCICIWGDAENSFDGPWAASQGVDLDRLVIIPAMLAEEMFKEIERLVPLIDPPAVVIDSIGGLVSWQEVMKDKDDDTYTKDLKAETMALQARFLGKLYRRFTPMIRRHQPAFVFITHIYSIISTGYSKGPQEDAKGGNAMKHHTHLWIGTSRRMGDQDKKSKIKMPDGRILDLYTAYEVVYTVKKTRQSATEGHKVAVPFIYGKGLSEMDSVLDMAFSYGIIQVNGNYYHHPSFMPHLDPKSNGWVHGRDNTITWVKQAPPEVFNKILEDLGERLVADDVVDESELVPADQIEVEPE